MNTGPMLTSIEAVPASTLCSAAFEHVVGAEPQQPDGDQARDVGARGQRVAPREDDQAKGGRADEQAPERERAGRQVASRVADADGRRGPQQDGDERAVHEPRGVTAASSAKARR